MLLVLAAAPTVRAQPAPAADAQKAFEDGKKAYNLGQFDKAIELWTRAYEIKPNAVFLYNIAQAHRQQRDFVKAILLYKSYLREAPDAPNRADVETKIADMQKLLDEQNKAGDKPPQDALDPTKPPPEPPPPEPVKPEIKPEPPAPVDSGSDPGKGMKIAGIAVGAGGVGLIVVGVLFSLQAKGIASDLEEHTANGDPWSAELSDMESSGKSKSTLGVVMLSVGAVAVLGGGTIFILGMRKSSRAREHVQIIPTVAPGLANVSVRWTF
jgi:tetratricopeptide (TPR) repeat protein